MEIIVILISTNKFLSYDNYFYFSNCSRTTIASGFMQKLGYLLGTVKWTIFQKLFYTSGFDLTKTAHLLRAGPLLLQVLCCSVLLDLGNETNKQHCR